ncbi:plant/protein [Thalictrum thalictroides]|uniref:Plant/protein n=1 Tax=Thalictrum thalictroides TaxID=46969 RepID=A0A7J6VQ02_THATH|nr:plant/protein [Thalictrum thalictroides]
MASTATLLSVRPAIIRSSATPSGDRKPDTLRQKFQPSSSSSKWWTPLFGWSSNPDYIDNDSSKIRSSDAVDLEFSSNTSTTTTSRSRFAPGGFTDEKAKQLRLKTIESTTFHDIMYHSAIASRLASDQRSVY